MRLLHLHSGTQFGGIERALVTFARLSPRATDAEHVFGICFRGRLWNELSAASAQVVSLGTVRLARPETILRARHAARRLISDCTPDIVITHSPWSRAVFGPVLRQAPGRSLHWVHGCSMSRRWIDRFADRYPPDACLFNSAFTAAICAGRYKGLPSTIVYSPVHLPAPAEPRELVRNRFATDPRDIVLVHAGRMEESHGHLDLVEAARLLPVDLPWTIWFAGSPQTGTQRRYYERLQAHVARCGLAVRVRFAGESIDPSSLLYASDIFCQTSEVPHPSGIDLLQAMSAGLPIVATELGAAPELVSDEVGSLVGVHDPASLAHALYDYVTSAERRTEAGTKGRERAVMLGEPAARLSELIHFLKHMRGAA